MKSHKKIQAVVIVFFSLVYISIYFVTTDDKNKFTQIMLEQQISNLENNYKVSKNNFATMSSNFKFSYLQKDEILSILYKAKYAKSDDERAILRKKLYERMKPYFEHLNQYGVNILLFSFENNKTFLRVHKLQKYDDNLSDVRYSFKYVNEYKKSVSGFEQGKISHAFRNIFPLFYKGEFVGSVDLAFSSEVLQENMTKVHGLDSHFIVDKSIFDVKVWPRQNKVKYIQSIEHEDFLFSLTPSQNNSLFSAEKLALNESLKDQIATNINHRKSFALHSSYQSSVYTIAFLAIKNIKDKKTVAYLVSYDENEFLKSMFYEYILINLVSFLGLFIVTIAILYNIKQRANLQVRILEEVEKNKLQQEKIFEQSKLAQMGELISMIAHQWRQPLATISATSIDLQLKIDFGTLEFKEKKEKLNKQVLVKSLGKIDALVQNLSTTIDDFRNFYKPNKTFTLISFKDLNIKAMNIIEASLLSSGIEIITLYKSEEKIKVFENEMIHVLLNILKNAQDNFQENSIKSPTIKITTEATSITIYDNGGGIAPEVLEKIFNPYFSTKDEKNGTGLGLYMSKTIVEKHHKGEILAYNHEYGVCFEINFLG